MNAFRKWAGLILTAALWLAASWHLMPFVFIKFENLENWQEILTDVPAGIYLVFYIMLTVFLLKMLKHLDGWDVKLDAIIAKSDSEDSSITITVNDLPTAVEIVRDPANHALLREKLERLNYLFLTDKLTDGGESWKRLKQFIDNCEKELARAERNKQARRMPVWAWVRLLAVAVLWLAASLSPMMVDHWLTPPSTASEGGTQVQTGKTENEHAAVVFDFQNWKLRFLSQSRSFKDQQPAAWLRILISAAFICIYLAFYAILTVALFKMSKHLRQHYRQKRLHEDLTSLAALLAVRIDREDTARQQLKDRILRILISDDSEE